MLLIDLDEGRIIEDEEIKNASRQRSIPTRTGCAEMQFKLTELPDAGRSAVRSWASNSVSLLDRQQAFGYTQEDLQFFLEPMAAQGDDPIGSMGADTPIAVLSRKPKLLYNYFKQNFAQVTNPPIDPIREELVMSLVSMIGPRPNLLGLAAGTHKRLESARSRS
jgi:glutamate synthase (NADPH/NADH) large chain